MFVSFAPPCDHTSCGTCSLRVMYPPDLDCIVCLSRFIIWYGLRNGSTGATGGSGDEGDVGMLLCGIGGGGTSGAKIACESGGDSSPVLIVICGGRLLVAIVVVGGSVSLVRLSLWCCVHVHVHVQYAGG